MTARSPRLSRRSFLTTAAGVTAAATLAPSTAFGRKAPSKIRDIHKGPRGTTVWMDLESAPFPHGRSPWKDPTVIAFIPHHYRVRSDYRVDTVLHFHGYRDTAEAAMQRHQLREQLYDSKQNAIIVFPQGPVKAESPEFGKLDQPRGLLTFLTELRRTLQTPRLQAQLGPAGIPGRARIGQLILSAHSGGFRVVSRCLEHGGFEVGEVYLFDALYGQTPIFRDWLAGTWKSRIPMSDRRKLVSFYSEGTTAVESKRLMRELDRLKIPYAHELKEGTISRRDMTQSRAVFIQTRTSHQGVLWRTNGLTDCLYASGLRRYLDSKWFDNAAEPRTISTRPK